MPASQGFLDFEDRAATRQQQALNAQYLNAIMGQMQQRQMEQARENMARQAAGRVLLGMGGGGAPGGIPMPGMPQGLPPGGGMAVPPAVAAPAPAAPPPGSMSPGGGNPAVMPPAPAPAAGPPGGGPGPAPAAPVAGPPPPPPPFRPMPTIAPPPAPMGPGGIPMPAAPAPRPDAPPQHFNVGKVVDQMKQQGIPPDQALGVLEQLMPVIQASQQQELQYYKTELQAQTAAINAYRAVKTAEIGERRAATGEAAEVRRTEQGNVRADQRQQEIDIKKQKETRLRSAAARGTGTSGPLKQVEILYDDKGEPVGTRGITKTGRIVTMDINGNQTTGGGGGAAGAPGETNIDAEGHQTPTLAGAKTAKERKASNVNVRDTVRSNLVAAGARNALARLDEIEKKYGDTETTSILFGQEPKGLLEAGAHAGVRSMQSDKQQQVDALWGSFIDEAIPVFTGGLRGSDAFRRFLIAQAPVTGSKAGSVAERRRLFRQNIIGTQQAFAQGKPLPPFAQNALNAYANDPKMWAPGVTKQQVDQVVAAARGGAGAGQPREFANEQEAAAAGLSPGTKVIINGVSGTWQ